MRTAIDDRLSPLRIRYVRCLARWLEVLAGVVELPLLCDPPVPLETANTTAAANAASAAGAK